MSMSKCCGVFAVLSLLFVAQEVSALQCVRYVKQQQPVYDKNYGSTKSPVYWIYARDLWDLAKKKGSKPIVGSVLVLDNTKFEKGKWVKYNDAGHVAIVVAVNGNKLTVRHQNWDKGDAYSQGVFTIVDDKAYWQGWVTAYRVRGFVSGP